MKRYRARKIWKNRLDNVVWLDNVCRDNVSPGVLDTIKIIRFIELSAAAYYKVLYKVSYFYR